MKTIDPPAPTDKSGVKIDYVAKRLAAALAPHGFKRKGRQFAMPGGTGVDAHWRIVQLQAGKWNEGPRGEFFVNLAVQFPSLMELSARRTGWEWMANELDKVDDRHAQIHARLGQLQSDLPPTHACARPVHSDEFKFRSDTDIVALADSVCLAVLEVGVPWLEAHAALRALADFEGSLLTADVDVRVAAAVLVGDRTRAQQILTDRRARFDSANTTYLTDVRAWFAGMGLDVSVIPEKAAPHQPSAWERKRLEAQQAEEAAHAAQAAAIRADAERAQAAGAPMALRPGALAAAWVAEHRAQWRRDPKPLTDLPSGRDVAALETDGRAQVLLALMQLLVDAEAKAGPRERFGSPGDTFDLDDSVRLLLEALLPTLGAASEATVVTVLEQMRALVTRWQHELVTGGYPWGFAALVQWLAGPAGAPHRAALKPGIAAWLAAYADFAAGAFADLLASVEAMRAKAVDPSDPMHDLLKDAHEREAELQAKEPPLSADEASRRIHEYPEQQMASADKQAVGTLRRELERDAESGALPVAWSADDWGTATQRAWEAAPPEMREALTPTLQRWREGVETRPTKQWTRTLGAAIGSVPASIAPAWRSWVLQQLTAFETSSGRTEWATTGPRPGVGARLGEASENLLVGLLWWAWHDPAIDGSALEDALPRVVTGAWHRLKDVGARAPAMGGLALRMLASLGDAPRAQVAALGEAQGASKQMKQAVQRALKEALVRQPGAGAPRGS